MSSRRTKTKRKVSGMQHESSPAKVPQVAAPAPSPHSALLCVDVLRTIFSFVQDRCDRENVRLVCRLWRQETFAWAQPTLVVNYVNHDLVFRWRAGNGDRPLIPYDQISDLTIRITQCNGSDKWVSSGRLSSVVEQCCNLSSVSVIFAEVPWIGLLFAQLPSALTALKFLNAKFWSSKMTNSCFATVRNLTVLDCSDCMALSNGCFDSMVQLTSLNCTSCYRLTNGCFDSLLSLTHLNCSWCSGLTNGCFDRLTGLKSLECWGISSLTIGCFDSLVQLRTLNCNFCKGLTDGCFDALVNLVSLECMKLKGLSDGCFDKLVSLQTLDCPQCKNLTDSSFNADCLPQLTFLGVNTCEQVTSDAFRSFTALRNIDCCEGPDLLSNDCFDHLADSLTALDCRGCPKMTDFAKLTQLRSLNCQWCSNLVPGCFDALVNLTALNCWMCTSSVRNGHFDQLSGLTSLHCSGCRLLTDGCFDELKSLQFLDCSSCQGLTISCFNKLTNLQTLECKQCNNLRNGCFDALVSLTSLNCEKSIKLTTGCFDALTRLRSLDCSDCELLGTNSFKSLTALLSLKITRGKKLQNGCFDTLLRLRTLKCDYCLALTDGCFDKLECLTDLNCTGVPVSKASVRNLRRLLSISSPDYFRSNWFDCLNVNLLEEPEP